MTTNATFDLFQHVGQMWPVIVALAGIVTWAIAIALKYRSMTQRIQAVEDCQASGRKDIVMLLKAQFATLDGLKQLNCNGEVKHIYDIMRRYVLENHRSEEE